MKVEITITFEMDWEGIENVSQIDIKQIQAIIERSTIMNYIDEYWIDSITEIE